MATAREYLSEFISSRNPQLFDRVEKFSEERSKTKWFAKVFAALRDLGDITCFLKVFDLAQRSAVDLEAVFFSNNAYLLQSYLQRCQVSDSVPTWHFDAVQHLAEATPTEFQHRFARSCAECLLQLQALEKYTAICTYCLQTVYGADCTELDAPKLRLRLKDANRTQWHANTEIIKLLKRSDIARELWPAYLVSRQARFACQYSSNATLEEIRLFMPSPPRTSAVPQVLR